MSKQTTEKFGSWNIQGKVPARETSIQFPSSAHLLLMQGSKSILIVLLFFQFLLLRENIHIQTFLWPSFSLKYSHFMYIATKFPMAKDWTMLPLDTDWVLNRTWINVKCISILSASNCPRISLFSCCPNYLDLQLVLLKHEASLTSLLKCCSGCFQSDNWKPK